MTNQHRATPEQWAQQALWVETYEDSSCIMELLHRIEALEAAQPRQDKLDRLMGSGAADDWEPIVLPSSPAGSLVERVGQVISDVVPDEDGFDLEARAAIREVAAWLGDLPGWEGSTLDAIGALLEQEATR